MKDRKEKMEALVELRKLKEERRNLQNALQVLVSEGAIKGACVMWHQLNLSEVG